MDDRKCLEKQTVFDMMLYSRHHDTTGASHAVFYLFINFHIWGVQNDSTTFAIGGEKITLLSEQPIRSLGEKDWQRSTEASSLGCTRSGAISSRSTGGWCGQWKWVRFPHPLQARPLEDPTGKTQLPHPLNLRHASLSLESQPVVRKWGELLSLQHPERKSLANLVHLQDRTLPGTLQVAPRPGPKEAGRGARAAEPWQQRATTSR